MKEYLTKNSNGEYQLVNHRFSDDDIEVPEGAHTLTICENSMLFWDIEENNVMNPKFENKFRKYNYGGLTGYFNLNDHTMNKMILWQRNTQPLIDNVNHPSHYTQGEIECIDAIEAATIGKNGIEAVCVGNAIKYLWRYEHKGGVESIKKAKWYIDKLIAIMEDKDS